MSRRHIAAFSLFLVGSVALIACSEDDDADPKATASGTGASSTGASAGTGGTGATGASGGGGSGGGGGPVEGGCAALPIPDALVESGSWDDSFTIAGFEGFDGVGPTVHDLALDTDGSLLAVGYFAYIGKETVRPFARRSNGTWEADPRLDMDLEQPEISSVAVADDGRVAISTHSLFPADLQDREGKIYVSNDTGGLTEVAAFHGAVRTMTWLQGKLWVGGYFLIDGGAAPPNLAVWDGTDWAGPPGGPVTEAGDVMELTPDAGGLLVGGFFTGVGGIAAQSAARFDNGTWNALDLPDSTVMAFARDANDVLYAGGLMSVEGSELNGGIARWSGTEWVSMDGGLSNLTFRGVVSDLAVLEGELVVAGCFKWAGGAAEAPGTIEVPGMARWTGTDWEELPGGNDDPVGTPWFSTLKCGDEGPSAAWESERQRMLVDGNRLYLAGSFPGAGGVASQSIIAYENGQWQAEGTADRGFAGTARVLSVGGPQCSAYALGGTHAGDQFIGLGVVKDDNDAWVSVAGPLPADAGYCSAMAVDADGHAYVGCENFDNPTVGAAIYREAGGAWEQWKKIAQGGPAAMAFDPAGHLWVVGGNDKGYAAREVNGDLEFTTFDARVSVIAFGPSAPTDTVQAAVAGFFNVADGQPAVGVAAFDGTAWSALGDGLIAYITSIAYGPDGVIYVGTGDGQAGAVPAMARWDGSVWEDVAVQEPGPVEGAGYQIWSMVARGKYVIAAGFGWPDSGERNLFLWNDETKEFRTLAGGATAINLETAALAKNGLWLGGTIAEAGPPTTRIPSVGVAHLK